MYSRNYNSGSGGAVKAFEDAYAREEFLRRSAASGEKQGVAPSAQQNESYEKNELREHKEPMSVVPQNNDTAKRSKGLAGLFSGYDSGDMILLLLIVFFLFDSDTESDSVIPVLLTVLLLF